MTYTWTYLATYESGEPRGKVDRAMARASHFACDALEYTGAGFEVICAFLDWQHQRASEFVPVRTGTS